MVDDHPMILEGYLNTLRAAKKEHQELKIDIANDAEEAKQHIDRTTDLHLKYDIIFLDIKIPPSADKTLSSGEDVAKYAKRKQREAKIIILTMFNEPYRIHTIVKNINPEGFLIKSDLTSKELASGFLAVLNGSTFYSTTVNRLIQQSVAHDDITVDEKNRKILHLLSQGIKTKNLPDHIDLSMSAIEKRKKQLKILFSVHDGQDETLLKEAKNKGFI